VAWALFSFFFFFLFFLNLSLTCFVSDCILLVQAQKRSLEVERKGKLKMNPITIIESVLVFSSLIVVGSLLSVPLAYVTGLLFDGVKSFLYSLGK